MTAKPSHPFGEEARNYRHGHKPQGGASGEYITWNGMRARCRNKENPVRKDSSSKGTYSRVYASPFEKINK